MRTPAHGVSLRPVVATALGNSAVPVLIVDDNAGKRLALRSILAPLGYRIVEADSGLTGLRCLMAEDFAVILMDVRMPIMDGFETSRLIRQRQRSEVTPIIFITAHGTKEMADIAAYATGAADFIFSPVPPAELRAKVSVFANLYLRAEFLAARARDVQESADQLTLLTDSAPVGIFRTDAENRYVYINPRWTEITGISFDEAIGRPWDVIMSPEDAARLRATPSASGNPEPPHCDPFEIKPAADLIPRTVHGTAQPLLGSDGAILGWVGTLSDVTVETAARAAIVLARDAALVASETDPLTRLSNRRRLEADLAIECARSSRYSRALSFIMLDADNFKNFNDTHGHQAGDEVLQELSEIFADTLRASDTAYRYGGEEFCLLLRETAAAGAVLVAERLRTRLEQHLSGRGLRVTASFGVATFPEHGGSPEELVAAADMALYAAKRAGRNCVVLCPGDRQDAADHETQPQRDEPEIVTSAGDPIATDSADIGGLHAVADAEPALDNVRYLDGHAS